MRHRQRNQFLPQIDGASVDLRHFRDQALACARQIDVRSKVAEHQRSDIGAPRNLGDVRMRATALPECGLGSVPEARCIM